MKAWRIAILAVFTAVLGAMVVCHPAWLAGNEFLKAIMTHEIVSILVVVLTITFASVANIHLAITRIVATLPSERKATAEASAAGVRREINTNAWTIFWAFVVIICVLVWKGAFAHDLVVVAAAHAIGLVVILVNILVLHDVYRAIFRLAQADKNGASAG